MMNERYGKTRRVLSLLIALVMVFGAFGSAVADTEEPQQERGASDYYLVGSMNGWNVNEDYKLTRNTGSSATEYLNEAKMLVASMYAFHEAEVEYRSYMSSH